MVYKKEKEIPRIYCFSLGDFHDFNACPFRFFVKHHLEKKYELSEGSSSLAIGSLLDLAIKKFHLSKVYQQNFDNFNPYIRAAETEMRQAVAKSKAPSFYSAQIDFLNLETLGKASKVFDAYYQKMKDMGGIKPAISTKAFWKREFMAENLGKKLMLWGGPDTVEKGADGMPEVADYKYFEDPAKSKPYLDMDLMPKIYMLLAAEDLIKAGYQKARFVTRIWNEPGNDDYYEEFDLSTVKNLEEYFADRIGRILSVRELSFCVNRYCKACTSNQRDEWLAELKVKDWID